MKDNIIDFPNSGEDVCDIIELSQQVCVLRDEVLELSKHIQKLTRLLREQKNGNNK